MAHRVTHAGLVVMHDAVATDGRLMHAGLVVMHGLAQGDPVRMTGMRQIQRIPFTGRSIVRWPKR